jgi:hypothetical protein
VQSGRDVIEAAKDKQAALFEQQSTSKPLTERQAYEIYNSDPILKKAFRSHKDLIINENSEKVQVSADGEIFNFTLSEDGKALRTRNPKEFRDDKKRLSNLLKGTSRGMKVYTMLKEGKLGGDDIPIGRDNDGKRVLTLTNAEARANAEQIKQQLMFAVNIFREEFNGGALHGPGEWEIFAKMISLPKENLEAFVNWFNENGADAVANAWAVTLDKLQMATDDAVVNMGFESGKSMFRTPEEIEAR